MRLIGVVEGGGKVIEVRIIWEREWFVIPRKVKKKARLSSEELLQAR